MIGRNYWLLDCAGSAGKFMSDAVCKFAPYRNVRRAFFIRGIICDFEAFFDQNFRVELTKPVSVMTFKDFFDCSPGSKRHR